MGNVLMCKEELSSTKEINNTIKAFPNKEKDKASYPRWERYHQKEALQLHTLNVKPMVSYWEKVSIEELVAANFSHVLAKNKSNIHGLNIIGKTLYYLQRSTSYI